MVVVPAAARLSTDAIERHAAHAYPGYDVYSVQEAQRPDRPDQVVLGKGSRRLSRLFDPYTGADLGDPQSGVSRALNWLTDLHDNLLGGQTGRVVNGAGAVLLTTLSLTGIVMWWPGIRNWKRSLTVARGVRFARFNWDLHSATGFWCFVLVFSWGLSGVALCFPGVLNLVLPGSVLYWTTQLHFGRFNWFTELVWTAVGLSPALLAVTGSLMWWNRVLSKKLSGLKKSG